MNYVYVVVDAPYCKIGYTNNPAKRLRELDYPSYNPKRYRKAPIRRIWPIGKKANKVEQAVISRLAGRRALTGREWFEIGWREMYEAVDACVLNIVGTAIPGTGMNRNMWRCMWPFFEAELLAMPEYCHLGTK